MKAMITGSNVKQLTVGDLAPGTLFKVNPDLSRRLFVRPGDGLSTRSHAAGRTGGQKIVGANSAQPPVWAIIVPTEDRFDRRAYTPASAKITASTPVISTHGTLVIAN